MNFKTTIVLIVLLAAAGIVLFLNRGESTKTDTNPADTSKLLDIDAKDVTKLTVTPADGTPFTLEKVGTNWQITSPVNAPAETFEVDALLRGMTDAKTQGQVDATGNGLNQPRYKINLVTSAKTIDLSIGDKSAVGDSLYVKVGGKDKGDIIPTELADKLEKGVDAYRKMNLVTTPSSDIRQINITRADGNLKLQKTGEHWQIISPTNMPADDSAVSDLLLAITGLRADSFVDAKSVPVAAMSRPRITVAFTTAAPIVPPATAPSTAPAWTAIQVGSFDDILKKNVFVTVEGSGSTAKVPATAVEAFEKKPLELRDKKAVNLNPEQVSKISVTTHLPSTTQPATKPAVNQTVIVERRKETTVMGPTLSTQPITTKPTSAPAASLSKWVFAGNNKAGVDDAKLTALLNALHPLTVDKYLETTSTTQPAGRYELTITTVAPGSTAVDHQITLIDPGHDQPLIGSYDGLNFEVSRSLLTTVEADLAK